MEYVGDIKDLSGVIVHILLLRLAIHSWRHFILWERSIHWILSWKVSCSGSFLDLPQRNDPWHSYPACLER